MAKLLLLHLEHSSLVKSVVGHDHLYYTTLPVSVSPLIWPKSLTSPVCSYTETLLIASSYDSSCRVMTNNNQWTHHSFGNWVGFGWNLWHFSLFWCFSHSSLWCWSTPRTERRHWSFLRKAAKEGNKVVVQFTRIFPVTVSLVLWVCAEFLSWAQ